MKQSSQVHLGAPMIKISKNEVDLKELAQKKREILRRKFIMKLLKAINEGKIDSTTAPMSYISDAQPSPRQPYISPEDRDTYNSGYMWMSEMMANSPNYK